MIAGATEERRTAPCILPAFPNRRCRGNYKAFLIRNLSQKVSGGVTNRSIVIWKSLESFSDSRVSVWGIIRFRLWPGRTTVETRRYSITALSAASSKRIRRNCAASVVVKQMRLQRRSWGDESAAHWWQFTCRSRWRHKTPIVLAILRCAWPSSMTLRLDNRRLTHRFIHKRLKPLSSKCLESHG